MNDSIFVLTEQRQSNDLKAAQEILQEAITAWLTKELTK